MPKYKMLINAKDFDQMRVAIVSEKGLLEQVDFESLSNNNVLGNIYKATITAIEPSLQASFVDYGGNRHGFLPFNEIHPRYFSTQDRRVPIQEKIEIGKEVLVQVAREEIGMKGAYLTTFLSLPGQYLVMMPLSNRTGISRKIEEQDKRSNLRRIMNEISVPDGMGYIIRTAGLGKSQEQIQRDLNVLISTWRELEGRANKMKSPCMLYQEDDVISRTIRDYFNEDVTEILVDDRATYDAVRAYFRKLMPSYAHIVKLYKGRTPVFYKYNIEEQLEKIFSPKIKLPSGGSIVIEQTEALVVIDVNSGKTSEGNLELTASKANLEAAEEVARQLRIRDLGGLIVIDFIDLKDRRNSQEVEQRLRECIKLDKARVTVTGISRFGLVEMSRQRIHTSKEIKHYIDCQYCEGTGRIKSMEMQVIDVLRKIKNYIYNGAVKQITVTCNQELGLALLNSRKSDLIDLEKRYDCVVQINVKFGHRGDSQFEVLKKTAEDKKKMERPAPISLSSMAASMSVQEVNERKDYREERLEALDSMTFEELRAADVPIPRKMEPFDRFNFSVRVVMMKKFGLYEDRLEEFKEAIRDRILSKGNHKNGEDGDDEDLEEKLSAEDLEDGDDVDAMDDEDMDDVDYDGDDEMEDDMDDDLDDEDEDEDEDDLDEDDLDEDDLDEDEEDDRYELAESADVDEDRA